MSAARASLCAALASAFMEIDSAMLSPQANDLASAIIKALDEYLADEINAAIEGREEED